MIPAAFDYYRPSSLEEALDLLSSHGEEAKLLAGGQSLLPMMKLRLATPGVLVDLGHVPGLAGLSDDDPQSSVIVLGAMTRYYQIEESDRLRQLCPLLGQTAAVVADVQVRHRGTIGGSLAHADPTGDMPAAALALDATVQLVGPGGARRVRAEDFITGFFSTAIAPDEVLTAVEVPTTVGWSTAYLKAAPKAAGFAIAGVAVCLRQGAGRTCEEVRIGITGVSDHPFRAHEVENALRGKSLDDATIDEVAAIVTDGLWIADDVHASAAYRAHMARLYTGRAIRAARDGRAAQPEGSGS